jgi:hypothetical protein
VTVSVRNAKLSTKAELLTQNGRAESVRQFITVQNCTGLLRLDELCGEDMQRAAAQEKTV